MMIDLTAFTFGDPNLPPKASKLEIDVPSTVTTKRELMARLAEGLHFPDYFGNNWDALDDCLRDLSWISEQFVVIRHAKAPSLPIDELRTYLDVLTRAIRKWSEDKEHTLIISFPASKADRETLASAAGKPPS